MSDWLDPYNGAAAVIFVVLFVAVPALGYVYMAVDFRAYLRSLRRSLVRVYTYVTHDPPWYRPAVPTCLTVFDLGAQCTEEQLKQAYFERVKLLHPDRGGDKKKFMRLQARFEEALAFVRANRSAADKAASGSASAAASSAGDNLG